MTAEVVEVQSGLNDLAFVLAGAGYDLHLILVSDDSNGDGICAPAPLGSG